MSPILNIQRRLHQDGRIRIGAQVPTGTEGKTRPKALDKFRFTSQNHRAIEAIAKAYGGEVRKWEGAPVGEQWEVLTESSEIPVVVPPESMSFSQWFEMWSGGGCQRRCDGATETISDGPCLCDPENRECKIHSRLSVMLAQYPGTGLWRLDSSGYNAAVELGGAMEIVGMLSASIGKSVLPGRLRIEHRTVKRPDQPPNNFIVPVLEFDVDMAALAAGNAAAIGAVPTQDDLWVDKVLAVAAPALTPVPMDDTPAPSLPEQLAVVEEPKAKPRRANAAPPIPATGIRPRTAAQAEAGERPQSSESVDPEKNSGGSSVKSTNKLRMSLRDIGVTDNNEVHEVVSAYVGRPITSLKELTQAEASAAIKAADAVEVAS